MQMRICLLSDIIINFTLLFHFFHFNIIRNFSGAASPKILNFTISVGYVLLFYMIETQHFIFLQIFNINCFMSLIFSTDIGNGL